MGVNNHSIGIGPPMQRGSILDVGIPLYVLFYLHDISILILFSAQPLLPVVLTSSGLLALPTTLLARASLSLGHLIPQVQMAMVFSQL